MMYCVVAWCLILGFGPRAFLKLSKQPFSFDVMATKTKTSMMKRAIDNIVSEWRALNL